MKRLCTIVSGFLCAISLSAQCGTENLAMKAGEKLTYDLRFNWKFVWTKAGTAHMETTAVTYDGKPALQSLLQMKGNKKADFFFTIRDTLTAIMSAETLAPRYFRKGAEEGKRYTVDEITFSYANGQTHISQSRHRQGKEPVYSEYTENRCIYDMLSLLARVRSSDVASLQEGQELTFPMATGTKVEEQTLVYRGKENFKADNGTVYRCLIFTLIAHRGDKKKEVITFYVTDDDNHLPVRLDMNLNFGNARAYLTHMSGNRYPLTSIIEKK